MNSMQFICNDGDIAISYITHPTIRDQYIEFDTRLYKKVAKNEMSSDAIYFPINNLLKKLPIEKQLKMYDYYSDIRDIIDRVSIEDVAITKAATVVAELMNNILTFKTIDDWRRMYSDIPVPQDLVQEFYSETVSPRTYDEKAYQGLIVISLVARFMAPIWGHFINAFSNQLPEDMQEYYAYSLLFKSWFWTDEITETLENYLQYNMDEKGITKSSGANSAIAAGVPTIDLSKYLLATSLVRRAPIPNLYNVDNKSNLIAIFYRYAIDSMGAGLNKKFAGRIEGVNTPNGRDEGGDNITVADNCKVKELVPSSSFIVNNYYMKYKIPEIIRKLCDRYNEIITVADFSSYNDLRYVVEMTTLALLKQERSDVVGNIAQIKRFRLLMTQWTLGSIVSPYAIMNGGLEEIDNMITVTVCYLLKTGHIDIAIWLLSTPILSEGSRVVDESSISGVRCNEVGTLYPHFNRTNRANTKSDDHQRKRSNPAVTGAQEAVKLIPYIEWKTLIPEAHRELFSNALGFIQTNGVYFAPHGRISIICNYAAHIGQNNQ